MRAFAATAMVLSLTACDYKPPEPKVKVEDAIVTLPALPGRPGAAYFTLRSNNDPTRLVSVTSPAVGRIELHGTSVENGVTRMEPLQDLTFAPDGVMAFKPGAKHAMLFGIDPSLRAGGKVLLTFTFEPLKPVTVEAEVRGPGAMPAHH